MEETKAKEKYIFGVVRVGEKGQIVIPKEAREVFGIRPGDSLVMLGDIHQGIALCKTEIFEPIAEQVFTKDRENSKGKEET